jgi:putative MFS transporter
VNGTTMPARALAAVPASGAGTVGGLWRPEVRRSTVTLWIAWFAIGLAYYGLFVYLPTILADRGFSVVRTYGYSLILAAAQVPGYLSAAWLVERWGRRYTLMTYLAASGAFTVLFAVADSATAIVGAAALMSFFALGAWAALYAYTPESYPTAIRTTGMGWASAMARIAAALVTLLGATVIAGSMAFALVFCGVAFLVGALAVGVLGTETRGRALADGLSRRSTAAG